MVFFLIDVLMDMICLYLNTKIEFTRAGDAKANLLSHVFVVFTTENLFSICSVLAIPLCLCN